MNNCCSLTLRVGRIQLDSESQATSMGQLFISLLKKGSVPLQRREIPVENAVS